MVVAEAPVEPVARFPDSLFVPDESARTATIRLRSRYLWARDSVLPVAIWFGDPPVLVDGCQIEQLGFSWGASVDAGVTTGVDAGGGSIALYDPDRLYDPTNDQTGIAGTRIGSTVRVSLGGVPAFRGRVDDVAHDLVDATFAIVDDVGALASVQFTETNVPAETASARVTRILDLAGWPASRRDVGPGGVALQAGTVAQDAWSELVEVTRNELGALWFKPDGTVAWRNRATAWAGGAPVMTFGCPPSDAYLTDLATRADQSALVNVLSAARRTGTQRTVSDSASVTSYGVHSHVQNDLELAADGDRDLWQDFYLRRSAAPVRGVGGFATVPGAAAITKLLGVPFGSIVRIVDEGHGPSIDRPARYLGSRWTITPTSVEIVVVTGEDASIRAVDRSTCVDTPADWDGLPEQSAPLNVGYREPGLAIVTIPASPAAPPTVVVGLPAPDLPDAEPR